MSYDSWSMAYFSLKVVVCIPLWCEADISDTLACALGTRWLISVDFPTPEFPDSSVVLPCSNCMSCSVPFCSVKEAGTHGYPIELYRLMNA